LIELADGLQARAEDLAESVVAEMYAASPFWDERYGERGRRFAREDNLHHVRYLSHALRSGSPAPLLRYTRWLQSILTTRGMCSRHIADNFVRLAEAIPRAGVPQAQPALDYLAAAADALTYADGPARAVQQAADQMTEQAMKHLETRWGASAAPLDGQRRAAVASDVGDYAAYLADALALGQPDLFVRHVQWMAGFHPRHGHPPDYLPDVLGALVDALVVLPPRTRAAAQAILSASLAAITLPPAGA
jgi:hypothetical protein